VFYERGLKWYQSLHQEISPSQTGIDASPFYFLDGRSAQRIATDQPRARLILGIRRPSEMICAMYERIASSTLNMPSFESYLESFHWDIGSGLTLKLQEFPFVERIREFQQLFGERLLLYDFEILNKDPLSLLNRVETHLGLAHHFNADNFDNLVINASKRRNNKRLSLYLKNEKFIDALIALVPRKIINKSRALFLKASKARLDTGKPPLPAENVALAEKYFKEADLYVARLFSESPFVLGSELENTKQTLP
jgi:hypothetical protein